MDYTTSVYLPEVALQNTEELPKEELYKRAGVSPPTSHESAAPLLVHLLRQLKQHPGELSSLDKLSKHEEVKGSSIAASAQIKAQPEVKKQPAAVAERKKEEDEI